MEEQVKLAKEIYDMLKDLYKSTKEQLLDKTISMEDFVRKLFQTVGGQVYIKEKSPRYCGYDGSVLTYTIAGSISIDYQEGDFNRLIEDLTMACYKNSGGTQITYTPKLIEEIKKM